MCRGKASALIETLNKRREMGLCTPKQANRLEKCGFVNAYKWTFEEASKMISQLAAVGWKSWKLPFTPQEYVPQSLRGVIEWT